MATVAASDVASSSSRQVFGRLCGIALLAYTSYAMCRVPLLPLYARELGASPSTVGFVMAASTVTGILLKLPAGAWSDILGRRPLLILGTIVFATMPFTYLVAASLGVLMALRFIHGSATAIFGPVASASVSDLASTDRRGTWLSTYATVQGIGQVLGPVIGGYLIATSGYRATFLVAGALSISTPFIASRWLSTGTAPTVRKHDRRSKVITGVVAVLRHRLILITSLAQAAQFVLNGTLNAFLPLFAHDALGLSPADLGWLFALQTTTTLAARPLVGMMSDRVGRRGVITAGLSMCGLAVIGVSFAATLRMLMPAIVAYATGVAVTTAATGAFITDLSRRAHYGAAHGVFGTIYDVGDALGPIAAGLLVASVGYGPMFRIMAGVTLTAAVLFEAMSQRAQRRGQI
jgi:MFS family permease